MHISSSKIIRRFVCILLITAVAVCCAACGDNEKSDADIQTVVMNGSSMEPTIKNDQVVEVRPLDGMPKTGDIILISHGDKYDKPLIKRVIAVDGQELKIDFNYSAVYVDGAFLTEEYTQGVTIRGDIPDDQINGVIPEGKVFVMGDNRTVSLDSRYSEVGLIDRENILGIVSLPD